MAGSLLNPAPDNQTFAGQNGNNNWSKLFDSPSPSPVVTLAQQTDMDRFRQLLKPGSSSPPRQQPFIIERHKISLPQTALSSGLASRH